MADPESDPLDALRAQVRATQEAAERLVSDGVPPRGWEGERADPSAFADEVRSLAAVLQTLRELLPPDLREQVADLVRQLLLVVRALIDWLVAEMERRGDVAAGAAGPGAGQRVEDIPIA